MYGVLLCALLGAGDIDMTPEEIILSVAYRELSWPGQVYPEDYANIRYADNELWLRYPTSDGAKSFAAWAGTPTGQGILKRLLKDIPKATPDRADEIRHIAIRKLLPIAIANSGADQELYWLLSSLVLNPNGAVQLSKQLSYRHPGQGVLFNQVGWWEPERHHIGTISVFKMRAVPVLEHRNQVYTPELEVAHQQYTTAVARRYNLELPPWAALKRSEPAKK